MMILGLSYFHIASAEANGDDKKHVANYSTTSTSKATNNDVQVFPARDGHEIGFNVQVFPARNEHEIEKLTALLHGAGMRGGARLRTSCSCYNCGTFQCYCRGCSSEFCCI
ncbi:hypothetical protein HAX54_042652 [Datura stramonium]|uniref:Uncharacterized protein n=1 Tax=Datura stramonium TaxID=4076 RepID=A0ABS8SMF5_DATST|nr:hypothetical protein [Datura stramonium]